MTSLDSLFFIEVPLCQFDRNIENSKQQFWFKGWEGLFRFKIGVFTTVTKNGLWK